MINSYFQLSSGLFHKCLFLGVCSTNISLIRTGILLVAFPPTTRYHFYADKVKEIQNSCRPHRRCLLLKILTIMWKLERRHVVLSWLTIERRKNLVAFRQWVNIHFFKFQLPARKVITPCLIHKSGLYICFPFAYILHIQWNLG